MKNERKTTEEKQNNISTYYEHSCFRVRRNWMWLNVCAVNAWIKCLTFSLFGWLSSALTIAMMSVTTLNTIASSHSTTEYFSGHGFRQVLFLCTSTLKFHLWVYVRIIYIQCMHIDSGGHINQYIYLSYWKQAKLAVNSR